MIIEGSSVGVKLIVNKIDLLRIVSITHTVDKMPQEKEFAEAVERVMISGTVDLLEKAKKFGGMPVTYKVSKNNANKKTGEVVSAAVCFENLSNMEKFVSAI